MHCSSNADGPTNEEVLTPVLDMIDSPMNLKNLSLKVCPSFFRYISYINS